MARLNNGPAALDKAVGKGLEVEQPEWATLQKQTSEYAQLAADLGKSDPPKGSKDSWAKLTAVFASSAAALDRAVQAKNRGGALEIRENIAGSCMECHREHRMMGGMGRGGMGRGGMGPRGGGPPGGGFPGGGAPPGEPPRGGPPPQ
jgi:hypothetical protein